MPRFAGHIAADKIAVGGHSFGGYSVFGFCGAIPERYDARIKAAVLYSPSSVGLLYDSSERRAHRVPTMYFIGGDERDNFLGAHTVGEWAAVSYPDLPRPKYFLEVEGAGHGSFTSDGDDVRTPDRARAVADRHDLIARYTAAFLERHVLGRSTDDAILATTSPGLVQCRCEPF